MAAFPYTLANLLDGRHRILYAPTSVAVPDDIGDIIGMVSPYTKQTGWVELGATASAAQAARNLTKGEWNIQQTSANVNRSITNVERTFTTTPAEYTPELANLYEESTGTDTITSGANKGAQKSVPFGSMSSLTPYRVAVLAQRPKGLAPVTEPTTALVRGAWWGLVFYRMEITGSATESFNEGDMSNFTLEFEALPDPTITTEGEEYGIRLFENAPQTIV